MIKEFIKFKHLLILTVRGIIKPTLKNKKLSFFVTYLATLKLFYILNFGSFFQPTFTNIECICTQV
jgi:hypothetical protein